MQKQYEKNVWEKSNDAYSLSIRVQTTINHISSFSFLHDVFYHNINVKENVIIFQSVHALKKALLPDKLRVFVSRISPL